MQWCGSILCQVHSGVYVVCSAGWDCTISICTVQWQRLFICTFNSTNSSSQTDFNCVFQGPFTSITTITIWQRNMVASCCHLQRGCHLTWRRLISTLKALYLNPGELRAIAPPQRQDSTTTKPLRTTRTRMR